MNSYMNSYMRQRSRSHPPIGDDDEEHFPPNSFLTYVFSVCYQPRSTLIAFSFLLSTTNAEEPKPQFAISYQSRYSLTCEDFF
jgi:hypothetical protein